MKKQKQMTLGVGLACAIFSVGVLADPKEMVPRAARAMRRPTFRLRAARAVLTRDAGCRDPCLHRRSHHTPARPIQSRRGDPSSQCRSRGISRGLRRSPRYPTWRGITLDGPRTGCGVGRPGPAPRSHSPMRGIYRRAGALALVVTAVVGGAALLGLAPADSGVEYELAIARRGSVERVVTVNGTLAPVNSVTVGSALGPHRGAPRGFQRRRHARPADRPHRSADFHRAR